jgi:hypothetical protein
MDMSTTSIVPIRWKHLRRKKMEIHWKEMSGAILIVFPQKEAKVALQVLKGLNNVFKLSFIKEAIDDIEASLRPKLTMVVHNHLCEKCFTMVNDKDENCLKVTHDGDTMYRHQTCPTLKENRP